MSRKQLLEPVFDDDNPEWTEADFARAKPLEDVLPGLAAAIRKGRGPQKSPTKVSVTIRLSPDVLRRFKDQGPGWQSRIDDALRKVVGL